MTSDSSRAEFHAGLAAGLLAVLIWAGHFVLSRLSTGSGFLPEDITLFRYATAGLVMLPFALRDRRRLVAIGWGRALVLTALAGPPFLFLAAGGFLHAPLAHGAVLQPVATGLGAVPLAWLLLGDRPGRARLHGAAVVCLGLILLNWDAGAAGPLAWLGDLMFLAAGSMWALFTVLLKRWRIDAVTATAVVCVLSAAVMLPGYAVLVGFDRVAAASPALLGLNIVVQGVLAGVVAVVAYGRAVTLLGAGRAAMLPALIPGTALVLGIPVTGELPSPTQAAGAALAMAGLLVAVGLIRLPVLFPAGAAGGRSG